MVQCVGLGVPRRVRRCWRGATASHQGQDPRQSHTVQQMYKVTQHRQAKDISRYRQHPTWPWWFSCVTRVASSLISSRHWPNRKELHTSVPRPVRQKLSAPCTGTRSTHDGLRGYKSVHAACKVPEPAQLSSKQRARH